MTKIKLTQEQTLQLGMEIIAAMKADAYGMPLEVGRRWALEDTEIDEEHPDKDKPEYKRFIKM